MTLEKLIPEVKPSLQTTPPTQPIKPEETTPPPPVKPTEYYPGYGAELQKYNQTVLAQQTSLQALENQRAKQRLTNTSAIWPSATQVDLYADIKTNVIGSLNEYQSSEWRYSVLNILPTLMLTDGYQGKGLNSPEDVLKLVPNEMLTDADYNWLVDTYGKLTYLKPTLPEGVNSMEEAQNRIIQQLQTNKINQPLKGVSGMAVEELAKYFSQPKVALPTDISVEDMRSIMSYTDLPDEEKIPIDQFVMDNLLAWKDSANMMNLFRQELLKPEAPGATPGDLLNMFVIQPFMATSVALDKVFTYTTRSASAGITVGSYRLFDSLGIANSETDAAALNQMVIEKQAQGKSLWAALGESFNEWQMPGAYKFFAETSIDPTNLIGLGAYTKVADTTGLLLLKAFGKGELYAVPKVAGIRTATRIGSAVASIERGWNNAADYTFKALAGTVKFPFKFTALLATGKYEIPQTVSAISRQTAQKALAGLSAAMHRTFPKMVSLKSLSVTEFEDTFRKVINEAVSRPTEGGDMAVQAGGPLIAPRYIQVEEAKELFKGIKTDITWDTKNLARLNKSFLDMLMGAGSPKVTAGMLANDFGALLPESVEKLAANITKLKVAKVEEALARAAGKTVKDKWINLYEAIQKVELDNLKDPINKYLEQQGQVSASWLSRISEKALQSAQLVWMERQVIQPIARMNLLFLNFGPANYLENMMRSFLGGGEILVPNDYMGAFEFKLAYGDLFSYPWEAELEARRIEKAMPAIVDPKTGGAMDKAGRIPIVTRPIYNSKGEAYKWTFNLPNGEEVALTDALSYKDMWGRLTDLQAMRDTHVHVDRALYDLAPEQMKERDIIIENYRFYLQEISHLDKKDIEGFERVVGAAALRSPETVEALSKNLTASLLGLRQVNKFANKEMRHATAVPNVVKNFINESILDGSFFKDITTSMERVRAMTRELSTASLNREIDRIDKLASEFAQEVAPKNFEEFTQDMNSISAIMEGIKDRASEYRGITELRAHMFTSESDAGKYRLGNLKVLSEYLETSERTMAQIFDQLEKNISGLTVKGKPILKDAQKKSARALTDTFRLQLENFTSTRTKLNSIYKKISDTPAKGRDKAFWKKYIPEIQQVWEEQLINQRRLTKMEMKAKRAYLSNAGFPAFVPKDIPEVTGKLTTNHIAYLFGVTGDDTARALTKQMNQITIRPEQEYIDFIYDQAEAFAESLGLTPEAIGFSEDAIRQLYKDEWTKLGIDPGSLTPDSPTMMQLDNVFAEIQRSHDTIKFSTQDTQLVQKYLNGVADELRQTSMYREIPDMALWQKYVDQAYIDFNNSIKKEMTDTWINNGLTRKQAVEKVNEVYGDPKIGDVVGLPFDERTNIQNDLSERAKEIKVEGNGTFLSQIDKWFHQVDNDALQKIGKTAKENPAYLKFIHDTLKAKYPSGKIRIFRGSGASKIYNYDPLKREYTNVTSDKAMAKQFEDSWGLSFENEPVPTFDEFSKDIYTYKYQDHPKGALDTFGFEIEDNLNRRHSMYREPNSGIDIASVYQKGDKSGKLKYEVYIGRNDPEYMKLESEKFNSANEAWQAFYDLYSKEVKRRLPEINDVVVNVEDIVAIGSVTESELIIPSNVLKERINQGARLRGQKYADWLAVKEQAMAKGKEQHALAYPTYDSPTIIDESMRSIFPFWTYEAFRYQWIPRTFIRTPGALTGIARFMDYTDGGYIPIPFTDLQLNPLRGSIWMGGLRSLYLKDFPEYYDQFPGLEFMESIGRWGFYPGFPISVAMTVFGAQGNPQWSNVTPTWMQTPLEFARAVSPQHAGAILDKIYPDRFSDYKTMLALGAAGYNADEIWKKKQSGQKLDADEERLWLKYKSKANGFISILMQQTGLLRYKPQEYVQAQKEMKLAIQDVTGIPVEIQDEISKMYPSTGKRLADYYPLDVMQSKLVYQSELMRQWQGVATPLYPSSWTAMEVKITNFYEELDRLEQQYRHNGVVEEGKLVSNSIEDINEQFMSGQINGSQWRSLTSDLKTKLYNARVTLAESDTYKDVPKTLDEREAYMKTKQIPVPTLQPDQELLYYYYDLKPEPKLNIETGLIEPDFDTYFAYLDNLLNSLDPTYRDRLLSRIQSDWTPMEKLYWQVNRDFIKPYNNVSNVILRQYDLQSQQLINSYYNADTVEQKKIEAIVGPNGKQLISDFRTRISDAHSAMREVDPDMDAWLNFYGYVSSFKTTEAEKEFNDLKQQYLTAK